MEETRTRGPWAFAGTVQARHSYFVPDGEIEFDKQFAPCVSCETPSGPSIT